MPPQVLAPAVHTMNRMTPHHRRTWSNRAGALAAFVATVITCVAAQSRGADGPATPEMGLNKPTAEALEFFEKRIRPLLTEQCYQCHSAAAPKGVKGGLLLDSRTAVMKGGEGGPIVVPGNP